VNEVAAMLSAEAEDAQLKAQAIAGWLINVGSNQQVSQRLYGIEGLGSLGKVR
jgi:hypothetical protein